MYGTVFRMKPKPGQSENLVALANRWLSERSAKVPGFVAEYVLNSETRPGEHIGIVLFDSRENYLKNAADPEQDKWYREIRELLDEDPEWNDGELLFSVK